MRMRKQHWARLGLGILLMLAAYELVTIYAVRRREDRVAMKVYSMGGQAVATYCGPTWVPQQIQGYVPAWRITSVYLGSNLPLEMASLGLRNNAQVTDAGLQPLKELDYLKTLDLNGATVTDTTIDSLKQLKGLTELNLENTQTTDESLDMLRKALPNCRITPDEFTVPTSHAVIPEP